MRLLLFLFLLAATGARAQSLLLNGDFEVENVCSEYKQNCAPEAWLCTVPAYPYFYEDGDNAFHGERYIGFVSGNERLKVERSFVRSRLLCGMRPGAEYRLQLLVRTDFPPLLDSSGLQFSPYDILCNRKPPRELAADFFFRNAVQQPARLGWTRLTFTYKARGDEGYLAIGNFRRVDWSAALGGKAERYQVYVDSISLVPLDPYERLCPDWPAQRDTIYSEDYRHNYQIRYIYSCSRVPPRPVLLPRSVQVRVDTLIVPDVLFATNSADLNKRALLLLDSLSRKLPPESLDSIVVEGHTDNVGSAQSNQELSEARARSVGHYLEYGHSVPVQTRGWGATRPVADNRSAGGRRSNRRVEIYLFLRGSQ
ncbi:MAG: OmpA family protein [Sphingobacteriales bacterium]|nr:MAG: OmpA family protein [Sphingobacteriales bacterium]